MVTEGKDSLVGGLAALAAQPDSLYPDQKPRDLSRLLKVALAGGELDKMYLPFDHSWWGMERE